MIESMNSNTTIQQCDAIPRDGNSTPLYGLLPRAWAQCRLLHLTVPAGAATTVWNCVTPASDLPKAVYEMIEWALLNYDLAATVYWGDANVEVGFGVPIPPATAANKPGTATFKIDPATTYLKSDTSTDVNLVMVAIGDRLEKAL